MILWPLCSRTQPYSPAYRKGGSREPAQKATVNGKWPCMTWSQSLARAINIPVSQSVQSSLKSAVRHGST